MKTEPIRPARVAFDDAGPPFAPDFGDVYHARAGALEQARHVFLGGNALPRRWAGCERFVVLETGFGLGHNFLATRAAWRADPQRCRRLWFVSIDKHPPTRADLARAHAASPLRTLADDLVAAWPPPTHNLHTLAFDGSGVTLLLAFGDVARWLPEIGAAVDAFYLDGFAPACNPAMWEPRLFKAIGRLAAADATAATWSAARRVRDGLADAGFEVSRGPGFDAKREMTVARYAPRFVPRGAPARAPAPGRDAVVVGAGLAGATTARALADEGFDCVVLDQRPAAPPPGPLGGLFHGTVHAQDGVHARFNRAAALEAARELLPLIRAGRVAGQADGLLRLETRTGEAAMHARLAQLGLPADYVQALGPAEVARRAGLPQSDPAWFYPGAGWLDPVAFVHDRLDHPGIRARAGVGVRRWERAGERWQVHDADGRVVADAAVLVLATGVGTPALLGDAAWPVGRTRGQVTIVPPGVSPAPRIPVAGHGYALTLADGAVLCGATTQPADPDPALRSADQRHNLDRLARLTGVPVAGDMPLAGRVGWRLAAIDRLPIVGALPDLAAPSARADRPRLVSRQSGLFVHAALGSRGLTWSPLGARLLAAWIAGAPLPLEASLVDAVDPARFAARAARRGA